MRMSGSAPALVLAITTFVAAPSTQTLDPVSLSPAGKHSAPGSTAAAPSSSQVMAKLWSFTLSPRPWRSRLSETCIHISHNVWELGSAPVLFAREASKIQSLCAAGVMRPSAARVENRREHPASPSARPSSLQLVTRMHLRRSRKFESQTVRPAVDGNRPW